MSFFFQDLLEKQKKSYLHVFSGRIRLFLLDTSVSFKTSLTYSEFGHSNMFHFGIYLEQKLILRVFFDTNSQKR